MEAPPQEDFPFKNLKTFADIIRLLEQHPEWRIELRQLLLTEDLLHLPEQLQSLVAIQRRT